MSTKTILLFCLCLINWGIYGQVNANKNAVASTQIFLKTLDSEKLQKAFFPYDTAERRKWFFVPIERQGLPIMDMNEEQKKAALNMIKASVSQLTYERTIAIMEMEVILKQIEKLPAENHRRHPGKFYFSIFGTPDLKKLWGWRIEGHHISLNFSSENNKIIAGTPLFLGSNPAIVPEGYPEAGKQILKQEETMGLALLHSFSESQLKKAIVSEHSPVEITSKNLAHFSGLDSLRNGIKFSEMDKEQQLKLVQLINFYVERYPFGFAREFMDKIEKAGLKNLVFTWMGAKEAKIGNGGHYYRIQNDVLLIEYDNTQNNANHIHTVVRDLTNDFGEDILQKHYQQEHKNKH
ncbi:MAG: DUF3500 domain-containing protein [Bacteroidota bacterium]